MMRTRGVLLLCVAGLLTGCGRSDSTRTPATSQTATPSSARPQPVAAPDTSASPPWIERSRSWPDTLLWVFDSVGEHMQDGLLMRLRLDARQNYIPGYYKDSKPLECQMFMTLRPIPLWSLARGLVADSVVFTDPVRHERFPGIPILASERSTEGQTVRTTFSTNLAKPHKVDLAEGQLLEPVVCMHWEKRQIVAKLLPVPVRFIRSEEP